MSDSIDELADDIYEFVIGSDSDMVQENDYTYSVLSIDIGILNLGISVSTLDEEFNLIDIVNIDLIDITKFTHKSGPCKEKCTLNHTKTFSDWLDHVFQENKWRHRRERHFASPASRLHIFTSFYLRLLTSEQ